MCAILEHNAKVQIAQDDIEVYKVVWVRNNGYYAPYRGTPYLSEKVTAQLGEPFTRTEGKIIDEGLHSFMRLEDAMRCAFAFNKAAIKPNLIVSENYDVSLLNREYHVVKAIIPKGSHYYEAGLVPSFKATYVSDQLVMDFNSYLNQDLPEIYIGQTLYNDRLSSNFDYKTFTGDVYKLTELGIKRLLRELVGIGSDMLNKDVYLNPDNHLAYPVNISNSQEEKDPSLPQYGTTYHM